jgi:O-antigen/teichoic acid export membrane protein
MNLAARFRWFLAPSVLQAAVSFLTLPIATLWLGPAEYGSFALVSALAGLASAVACLGSSYVFATVHSSEQRTVQMGQAVSQQVAISLSTSLLFSVLLIWAWPFVGNILPNLKSIPQAGVELAAAAIVPATLWALAADVLTLDGRAKLFALISVSQSLLSAAVLLGTLYWFDLGGLALFLSSAAGAIVLGTGACFSLWRYAEWPEFSTSRIGAFRGAASITASNVLEQIYPTVERNLLAASSGIAALGLYTHAQQYRAIAAAATKALARAIWSVTLTEAQEKSLSFPKTGRHWNFAHLSIAYAGLTFAVFGFEIIGILTHGKFSGAAPYAAMGIALLLIQNSGKPCMGLLYATGKVEAISRLVFWAGVIGLGTATLTIPAFGLWGAVIATIIPQLTFRIAIQLYVTRYASVPFQDTYAIIGFFMILSFVVINESFSISPFAKGSILAVLFVLLTTIYIVSNGRRARS